MESSLAAARCGHEHQQFAQQLVLARPPAGGADGTQAAPTPEAQSATAPCGTRKSQADSCTRASRPGCDGALGDDGLLVRGSRGGAGLEQLPALHPPVRALVHGLPVVMELGTYA